MDFTRVAMIDSFACRAVILIRNVMAVFLALFVLMIQMEPHARSSLIKCPITRFRARQLCVCHCLGAYSPFETINPPPIP